MRNTRGVWRIRFEANREDIIRIVASDVHVIGSGLFVIEAQSCQLQLWEMLCSL
jgi:hypothetical protein